MLPFEKRSYTVIEKSPAVGEYGTDPNKRPIKELLQNGVITVNKPKGPTSHMVSEYVQNILKLEKSGHGGTLDPGVTGVLPVALDNATRIVQTLLPAGKEYICLMYLHEEVDEEKIRNACASFVGKIKQTPPVRSAVKRVEREREIYYLDTIEIDGRNVLYKVGCQAGTYIRRLCEQIGSKLGMGAHMAELIRTKAGPFNDKNWVSLQDLEDAMGFANQGNNKFLRYCIKPVEYAVSHLPKMYVFDSTIKSLCHGVDLKVPGISKLDSDILPDTSVAVMTLKGELIALGTADMTAKDILEKPKGLAVRIQKVFMKFTQD